MYSCPFPGLCFSFFYLSGLSISISFLSSLFSFSLVRGVHFHIRVFFRNDIFSLFRIDIIQMFVSDFSFSESSFSGCSFSELSFFRFFLFILVFLHFFALIKQIALSSLFLFRGVIFRCVFFRVLVSGVVLSKSILRTLALFQFGPFPICHCSVFPFQTFVLSRLSLFKSFLLRAVPFQTFPFSDSRR